MGKAKPSIGPSLNISVDLNMDIDSEEMRKYFGESMYNYLSDMINT